MNEIESPWVQSRALAHLTEKVVMRTILDHQGLSMIQY